jgi:micrococcal nuclease
MLAWHILRSCALGIVIAVISPAFAQKPTVVDGDTVKFDGKVIRLRNHNAPETSASRGKHAPKCDLERELGEKAKERLKEIVANGKTIEIGKPVARDVYGREVAVMKVDGRDPGDILRAEGLAKRSKGNWCR